MGQRRRRNRHILGGLALAAQTVFATPSLLIDPTFANRLGSFLAGPKRQERAPKVEQPETLTERLIRQRRLLRLSKAKAPVSATATLGQTATAFSGASGSNDIQGQQGPAGQLGGLLGGPVRLLG